MNFWGVIAAAGSGRRFGGDVPKQYLPLAGRPVICWSIKALQQAPLRALVVALDADDRHWPSLAIDVESRIETCVGGASRQRSVLQALLALEGRAEADDWVLVHDAARPCLRTDDLGKLLGIARRSEARGAILGWPADNALKRVSETMAVLGDVERRDCWNAATPQMFRHGVLLGALRQAEAAAITHADDAAAVLAAGNEVRIVDCAKDNVKITQADDLELASAIIAARAGNGRQDGRKHR